MKSSYTMISLLLVITSIAVTVNAQCVPCISSATPCYDTVGKCYPKLETGKHGGGGCPALTTLCKNIGTGDDGSALPASVKPTEVVKSLRVTEMKSHTARLQWIAPTSVPVGWRIDVYDIYYADTASPSPGDFILLGSTTASSFKTAARFSKGVDYYLAGRVKYTSIAGSDVEFSTYATFSFKYTMQSDDPTDDDTVPTGVPSAILFSEISDSGVRVMWLAPVESIPSTYVLNYKVALAINNGFDSTFSSDIYQAATTTVYNGLVADTSYTVRIQASYTNVVDNSEVKTAPISANFNSLKARGFTLGEEYGLVRDIFTSVHGKIGSLINDDRFVNDNPSSRWVARSAFSFGSIGDRYGQRFRALYIAPATGAFTFAISGNNFARLYLSTDSTAANKQKIAKVKSWTAFGDYDRFTGQTSNEIQLIAGEQYYIEALHVQRKDSGHISVKVKTPSGAVFDPIPAGSLIADIVTEDPTAVPPLPPGGGGGTGGVTSQFTIELRYLQSDVSPEVKSAFDNAAARWSEVIIGDLEDINFKSKQTTSGITFNAGDRVDDVIITVNLAHIDGPNGILGSAGPFALRLDGSPWFGQMKFDIADLEFMSKGLLHSLILHEMGHVFGIGTLWNWGNFFRLLVDGDTDNPYYSGSFGKKGLKKIGGSGKPLIANTGGAGTKNGHWREDTYKNELMTGYLSESESTNPMSLLTVLSLKDLGYIVNKNAADAFTVPSSSTTRLLRRNLVDNVIELGADTLDGDVIVTDAYGTVQEITPVDGGISDMEPSAEEIAERAGVSPDFTTTPTTTDESNDAYLAIVGVIAAGSVVGFIVIASVFKVLVTKKRNTDAAGAGNSTTLEVEVINHTYRN